MQETPVGNRAFLFTDVEGSTRRWERSDVDMPAALSQHDAILTAVVEQNRGRIFKHLGDGVAAVFDTANDALAAAIAAQQRLDAAQWPEECELRVRMGVHVGPAVERSGDFFGATVNRTARLMAAGHGGQVLISDDALQLVRVNEAGWIVTAKGAHHLRDLAAPMTIHQVHTAGMVAEFPALKTLDAFPTNLPRQLVPLTGRNDLMAKVSSDVPRSRLVTVVGTAGIGKTRLAQEVGADSLPRFPGGVWFVDLSAAQSIDSVVTAVASVAGVRIRLTESWRESFTGEFGDREVLVILDNCEHVIAEVADFVSQLLSVTRAPRFLATSRQRLGVAGEIVHRIEALGPLEAAELFCERSAVARGKRDLVPTDQSVQELCERLDGIPLAIELAAARTRTLSPSEIRTRLGERFRLLRATSTGQDHQRGLADAIGWSFDLLSPEEQRMLERLGVFAGTFELEAVEVVCADDGIDQWDVLDLLDGLIDKSLVVAESDDARTYYRLLDMIAAYALDKLEARGGTVEARDRHARYFLEWSQRVGLRLQGSDLGGGMAAARSQRSNIQAAMDWMGVRGWHPERVEVLRDLRLFFTTIGHGEGLRQFEALLAHGTELDPKLHVEVLVGAAGIYVQSGMHRKAEELLQTAERLSDELGVSWPADMIHFRAMIAEMDGRPDDVVTQCTRLLGSPELEADVFFDLLVRTRMVAGLIFARPDDALEFASDTLRRARDSQMDVFVAAAQLTLGLTHLVVTKDRSQAERCFNQTIELCADSLPSASIPARIGLALLALDDRPVEALELMSVALTQEAAGVDEPVARACCYDVAAAACAEIQDLDSARRLLRQAELLRSRCGFGGLAWTLPGRQRALDLLGSRSESRSTSPIDLTEETSGELIRLVAEVLANAAAPNDGGAQLGQ